MTCKSFTGRRLHQTEQLNFPSEESNNSDPSIVGSLFCLLKISFRWHDFDYFHCVNWKEAPTKAGSTRLCKWWLILPTQALSTANTLCLLAAALDPPPVKVTRLRTLPTPAQQVVKMCPARQTGFTSACFFINSKLVFRRCILYCDHFLGPLVPLAWQPGWITQAIVVSSQVRGW